MPGALSEFIRNYEEGKRERYKQYAELMDRALEAGTAALVACPNTSNPRRGAVWLRLADARSSFGRFLQEVADERWKRGNRQMGTHLPVIQQDFDKAMAWAVAVRDVLASGDVHVTIGSSVITQPGRQG